MDYIVPVSKRFVTIAVLSFALTLMILSFPSYALEIEYSGSLIYGNDLTWRDTDYNIQEKIILDEYEINNTVKSFEIDFSPITISSGELLYEYIFEQPINIFFETGKGTITSPEYDYPVSINLLGKDFYVIGVGNNEIKMFDGSVFTVSPNDIKSFNGYNIYSDIGDSDSWARIVFEKNGNNITETISEGEEKIISEVGLTVRVLDVYAPESTVIETEIVVNDGSTIKTYDSSADVTSVTYNDIFPNETFWGIQFSGGSSGKINEGDKIQVVYKPPRSQTFSANDNIAMPNNFGNLTFSETEEIFGLGLGKSTYHQGEYVVLSAVSGGTSICDYYLASPSGEETQLVDSESCGGEGYEYEFKPTNYYQEYGNWKITIATASGNISYTFDYLEKECKTSSVSASINPKTRTGYGGDTVQYEIVFNNENLKEGCDKFNLTTIVTSNTFHENMNTKIQTDWDTDIPKSVFIPLNGKKTITMNVTPPSDAVVDQYNISLDIKSTEHMAVPIAECYYNLVEHEEEGIDEVEEITEDEGEIIEQEMNESETTHEEAETEEQEDEFEEQSELEEQESCEGCLSGDDCIPYGFRKDDQYCDLDESMKNQKKEGELCENNFECKSNSCIGGKCISQSLINRIIEWLMNFFNISGNFNFLSRN